MPLTGPRSRVRKHLRVSSHLFPGHRTDPLTNRQHHLTTHRHTHKTHLTLQRKAANTSRAESINTARTLFYGSEHEYSEPSCGRRKYVYRASMSASFGDCLQFDFEFDFDSCCTVTDSEERPRRPLPRRRAQARSVRPDPIDIFELPGGFWDDATLSLTPTPTNENENENEPNLTHLLNVLSANDIYDAMHMNSDNDTESSVDFGRLFLVPANAKYPNDSHYDTEPHRGIGISICAPHNVNAHPQTPKKKNTPRFTPMAPKRGNKVIKTRSKVSKISEIESNSISKIGEIGESKIKSTKKLKSKSTTSTGNIQSNKTSNVMELDPLADADAGYEVPEHLILHIPFLTATTPASTSTPSLVPSESNPIPIRIPSSGIPTTPPPPPHKNNITTTPKPIPIPECPLTSDISHLNLESNPSDSDSDSVPGNVNAFSGPSFSLSPISISNNRDASIQTSTSTPTCDGPVPVNVLSSPSFTLPSSSYSDDIDIFMCSPPPPPPPHYIDPPQTQTATDIYNAFSSSTHQHILPLVDSQIQPQPHLYNIPTPTPLYLNHNVNATAPLSNSTPFNAFSTPCFVLSSSSPSDNTYIPVPKIDIPSTPFNAFSTPCFTLPSPSSSSPDTLQTYNTMTSSPAPPLNAFSTPCFLLPSSSSSSLNDTQIPIDIPSAPYNAFSTPCFILPSPSPSPFSTNNQPRTCNAMTSSPAPPPPFNAFSTPCFTLPSSSSSSSNNTQIPIDIPPPAPFNAFSTPCFTLPLPSHSHSSFSTNNYPHTYNTMTSSPAPPLPPPFNAFSTPCFTLPSPSPSPSSSSTDTDPLNQNQDHTHDTSTQPPTAIVTDPLSYASTQTTPVPYNFFSGPSFTLPSSSSSSSSSFSSNTNTNTSHRHVPTFTSTTPQAPRAPRAYTSHTQTQTSRLQRPTRFSDRHHPYHSKDTTHKDNKYTDKDKDVEMSDSTTTTTTHTTTLRRPVALTRTAKRDSAAVPPFIRDMFDRNWNRRSKESEGLTGNVKLGTQVDTDMVMDEFRVGSNAITQGQNHTDDLDVIMDEPDLYRDSYSYSCPDPDENMADSDYSSNMHTNTHFHH